MRIYLILAISIALIVGASGATSMVFFRGEGGQQMYRVNTDGSGLKLLDKNTSAEAIWISKTDVVYGKNYNLWRINTATGKKYQITFEGKVKEPKKIMDECDIGNCIIVDCPVYNFQLKQLYYRVMDMDTMAVTWKVRDLASKKVSKLPGTWYFVTSARGNHVYGDIGCMPSTVVTLDLETGLTESLTEGEGQFGDGQSRVSPDGKKLAYSHDMQIYLYDLATGDTTYLYNGAQQPEWSPDGQYLLCQNNFVVSRRSGDQYTQMVVVGLDGTAKILVEGKDYQKGAQFFMLAGWTPAGKIIWSHIYSGRSESRSDIKMIDPKTGQKAIIVKNGDRPAVCPY